MYNKQYNVTNKNLLVRNDLYCRYCGKQCKNLNSLTQHEIRCKENPNRISNSDTFKEYRATHEVWNKGLTKETDKRVRKQSDSLKENNVISSGTFHGRKHSNEAKKKISEKLTEYNHSNNRRHSHGKHGYYDNIYFMSTWELAFYIYTKDNATYSDIIRCNKRFSYEYENKKHYYTPDFICDGTIIEIKGWETELDKIKYSAVENLKVLYSKDIQPMIDYVKSKYCVTDISDLYDKDTVGG